MNISEQRPWYTNKDLFEQINSMRGDFRGLSNEMQETRKIIKNSKGDMQTNSLANYLKSIDVDSSFSNRKKLAAKHGIKNYRGTAAQNSRLLNKLR
ncbi:hypothetical protein JNUCC74_06555 [Cerasibacillus sp. JNUCC 74]